MTFKPRNLYYLRVSSNAVLPLYLYLDERHTNWMSDVVLQHVLADLRPLIIPKLQAEKDVHFGLGAAPGIKRGTVDVHRGETYQFAYFFRKTEPHTVVVKSRYFVTAPLHPESVSKSATRSTNQSSQKERVRTRVPCERNKRKRAKTERKRRIPQGHFDDDDAEESEEDMDNTGPVSRESRKARKQRRVIADEYVGDDEDEDGDDNDADFELRDITMESPLEEEPSEDASVRAADDKGPVTWDTNDQPILSPTESDIELVAEEEEMNPKPLLKLKYQSFSISGHCLCVVVEPWPPQRVETTLRLGTPNGRGCFEPSLRLPNELVAPGQRAKTPLFFPENDWAPSEVPFTREKTFPSVPLFHDSMSSAGDVGSSDDDLMVFSQALNAAGHMHAITADDEDDMDGAVLFGDADERRELL